MNRAQLLLSVLRDGQPHSRTEVFERVGFMLTNNAASELRAQGYDVQHTVEKNVHVYRLLSGRSARGNHSDSGAYAATPSPDDRPESSLFKIDTLLGEGATGVLASRRVDRPSGSCDAGTAAGRPARTHTPAPSPSSLSKIGAAGLTASPAGDLTAAPIFSSPGWPGGAALTVPPGQLPLWGNAA